MIEDCQRSLHRKLETLYRMPKTTVERLISGRYTVSWLKETTELAQ